MSGKAKNKGSLHYDTQTNTVMTAEDEIDEQAKHKVSRVQEVCPKVNKEEIILVLQHFAYDEESTVNAFMENGAADILKDWRKTGTKPNTKPKKKNKKKKKGQVTAVSEETENSSDNSHNVADEQVIPSQEETSKSTSRETKNAESLEAVPPAVVPLIPKEAEMPAAVENVAESGTQKSSTSSSPQSEAPKTVFRFRSSGSSRTASFSEDTSHHSTPLSSVSSYPAGQGKKSLDKSLKDLSRQTVALQRVHNLLEEELDNSFKRIRSAVAEAQKLLEERHLQLEEEMERVKKDARQLLSQRQELAAELKRRAERMSTMTDAELNDLRADIKQFVVERKYDEELGRTKRFVWDKDRITQEIKAFGELAHVKNSYSQRRQSTSSVASSLTVMTLTDSEQLGTQVSETHGDSAETHAQGETTEQKDYKQQVGNRSRIFVGKHYSNQQPDYRPYNSGGGRNRRGGYSGPRSSMGRRDEGHWGQQQRYNRTPHYQQRFYNTETVEGDGRSQPSEHRPSYRGNRSMHYRGRGYGPQHEGYNRARHPSKDLKINGENTTAKPADSSNIANGFAPH